MSAPRNKGFLPEEVAVLRSRIDGVELIVERAVSGMIYLAALVGAVLLLILWRKGNG